MHGTALPAGLLESAQLPEPVFTPSTKADDGDHDENISFEQAVEVVGAELAEQARDLSLELYRQGAALAAERGILIADTKFELGIVDGELVLADEVLTPDSSRVLAGRFVDARLHAALVRQAAIRDHLDALDWDKKPPPPPCRCRGGSHHRRAIGRPTSGSPAGRWTPGRAPEPPARGGGGRVPG